MEYLSKEYIEEQDQTTCEKLLKNILKDSKIDKPLIKNPSLVKDADDIVNMICYLEDRIAYLYQMANLEKANNARWGRFPDEQNIN